MYATGRCARCEVRHSSPALRLYPRPQQPHIMRWRSVQPRTARMALWGPPSAGSGLFHVERRRAGSQGRNSSTRVTNCPAGGILARHLASTSAILARWVPFDDQAVFWTTGHQEERRPPAFRCRRAGHDPRESRHALVSRPGGPQQKWRKSRLGRSSGEVNVPTRLHLSMLREERSR